MSLVAEQRHALIIAELERHQATSTRALCERLGVTRETIRRDLAHLAAQNLIRQVRGGAVQIENEEPPIADRSVTNPDGKQAIARTAIDLIPDGASVILDSGSTTQAAARELTRRRGITVYTNDIAIALRLRASAREVHLLGGRIAKGEDSTQGLDTLYMMSSYNADFALIGIGGLSADQLFTDYTREGAALRARMMESAATSILLVDHTKFGKVTSVRLRNTRLASHVITDKEPENTITTALQTIGLKATVAA